MFPNEIYVIILLSLNVILENSRERKHVAREETLELFLSVDIQPCTIGFVQMSSLQICNCSCGKLAFVVG